MAMFENGVEIVECVEVKTKRGEWRLDFRGTVGVVGIIEDDGRYRLCYIDLNGHFLRTGSGRVTVDEERGTVEIKTKNSLYRFQKHELSPGELLLTCSLLSTYKGMFEELQQAGE